MNLILNLIIFVISFFIIHTAGKIVFNSSVGLARYFKITEFFAGFLLVAVSTSLPEIGVTLVSGYENQPEIILGNLVGANICNLLFVLGVLAIVKTIRLKEKEIIKNAEALLVVSTIPLVLLKVNLLNRVGGIILIAFFVGYIIYIRGKKFGVKITEKRKIVDGLKPMGKFIFGIAALLISAKFLVDSALILAAAAKIPPILISISIISLGTTLPELAVGLNALKKSHYDFILGEILGSCVVNLTLVLGVGALLTNLTIMNKEITETILFFLVVVGLALTFLLLKYKKLTRRMGIVFVVTYIVFLLFEMNLGRF